MSLVPTSSVTEDTTPALAADSYAVAPPPPETRLPEGTTLLGTLLVLAADAMVLVALLAIWWTIKGGSPA